jgi:endonuclease/exonuclease/phosphatase family metal-dependent hydrolase
MIDGEAKINLNIVCWNLHAGIDWYGCFRPEQALTCLKALQPDLCGFQEVDRHWGPRSRFLDLARLLADGLAMYPVFSASLVGQSGSYGNLILSRYPPLNGWWRELTDSQERRSCGCVQVVIAGVKLSFFTTHLGLSAADRHRQAKLILGYIEHIAGPIIICGDFNAGPEDGAVRMLTEKFRDLQCDSAMIVPGTFRLADGRVGPRIDYILTTYEFIAGNFQTISNYCSDHLLLFARLNLRRRTDPVFYR